MRVVVSSGLRPSFRKASDLRRLLPAAVACGAIAFASLFSGASSAHAADIIANHADDVCAPTADPCVITDKILPEQSSVLDFGTRTVQIRPGGQLDFGFNSATILCGTFDIDIAGTATGIRMKDSFSGETFGGLVRIEARRACSLDSARACLSDFDCSSNAAGTCSVGTGEMLINGKIVGNADSPGSIVLRAADGITLDRVVNLQGSSSLADGGLIRLESFFGDVLMNAQIQVQSGGQGTGGDIEVLAGGNVVSAATLDAVGGDTDGGTVDLDADLDLTITQDVLANAGSGEGFGGQITMAAGGNLLVNGGSSSNRLNLATDGSCCTDFSGGSGGEQTWEANGNITIGQFVKMEANGAPPDADGEIISFDSSESIVFNGQAFSKGLGGEGFGGSIEFRALGDVSLGSTSFLDVEAGDTAGDIDLQADGTLSFDGLASADGGVDAGTLAMFADVVNVLGTVEMDGGASTGGGDTDIEGCVVTLASNGDIANRADGGTTTITGRRFVNVEAGAQMRQLGNPVGTNGFLYRLADHPPAIDPAAVISPTASEIHIPSLASCAVCGDGFVEAPETCDDGNTASGDGCSDKCQDEGCIADTPGYPTVPLCSDGNDCTDDSCNTITHACEHSGGCDDGIDCTVDSCVAAACVNTADHGACEDGNLCTTNTCSTVAGCRSVNNAAPCDDGVFCNGDDTCSSGQCVVHAGDPCTGGAECADSCDELADSCLEPTTEPCTADTNPCTDDLCDGSGLCAHPANTAPCDDLDICTQGDVCASRMCTATDPHPMTVALLRLEDSTRPGRDRLWLVGTVSLSELTTSPVTTGMRLLITEADGSTVLDTSIAPGAFTDAGGAGTFFRYKSSGSGIRRALIRHRPAEGIAKVRIDATGLSFPALQALPALQPTLLFGTDPVSDDCVTGKGLACKTRAGDPARVNCRNGA